MTLRSRPVLIAAIVIGFVAVVIALSPVEGCGISAVRFLQGDKETRAAERNFEESKEQRDKELLSPNSDEDEHRFLSNNYQQQVIVAEQRVEAAGNVDFLCRSSTSTRLTFAAVLAGLAALMVLGDTVVRRRRTT